MYRIHGDGIGKLQNFSVMLDYGILRRVEAKQRNDKSANTEEYRELCFEPEALLYINLPLQVFVSNQLLSVWTSRSRW